jgi:hypothetical protein
MFGLAVPQLLLAAAGIVAAVIVPASTRSGMGLAGGLVAGAVCWLLAFCPVDGRPVYEVLPALARFAVLRRGGRSRWVSPLPLLTGTAASIGGQREDRSRMAGGQLAGGTRLPQCLTGLELIAVARPAWTGDHRPIVPVGLVRDRRHGTVTAVLSARGGPFSLLDVAGQHDRLADWATVLSQFGREVSPVTRLGWTLWSAPAPLSEHLDWLDAHVAAPDPGHNPSTEGPASDYRRLVDQSGPTVCRHDLRLWLTVDPRRLGRQHGRPPKAAEAALGAARALVERCRAAGLVVSAPLSPVEIAEAMRVQADPSLVGVMARMRRGLAEHVGLASVLQDLDADAVGDAAGEGGQADALAVAHAGPLAIDERWDAVRVDGAWHRVFWVSQWPGLTLDLRWLEPLLLAPPCVRTIAVMMEPVSLRASRRRINSEAVSIEGQLQLRERHAFRVPVHLQRAHAEVDAREAELQAGFCEYAHLALLAVTAHDLDGLDEASYALVDQAAQCGVTELRPVHARQAAAWACTLPVGRAPDRQLLRGASA